jgi:hypothetical protein
MNSATAMGPDCASCHFYPPPDANHIMHLGHLSHDFGNGTISCRDCHAQSIPGEPTLVFDSVYLVSDASGDALEWSSVAFPDHAIIRNGTLVRVDTLRQIRPIEQPGETQVIGYVKQWMTGAAHLNGVVDIDLDTLVSDTSRFGGRRAEYRAGEQSCSAVRCHSNQTDYQWAAPSKGLPGRGRYHED